MPDWKQSIAAYEKAGFALCGFFPVSSDEQRRAEEARIKAAREAQEGDGAGDGEEAGDGDGE